MTNTQFFLRYNLCYKEGKVYKRSYLQFFVSDKMYKIAVTMKVKLLILFTKVIYKRGKSVYSIDHGPFKEAVVELVREGCA